RDQARDVADLVALLARDDGHAIALVAAPERFALADHPDLARGDDLVAGGVLRLGAHDVVAGVGRVDALGVRAAGREVDVALDHLVLALVAVLEAAHADGL